ncbi:MAG: alkylated DNA repair dioxygenase AlkB [Flavobacteriales bacterium]|jgi:alkylated DNA repair dioxygenase AlkB
MNDLISDIIFDPDFFDAPEDLFALLTTSIKWNDSMRARKTASFGQPANNSEQKDPLEPFLPFMDELSDRLEPIIGFRANNCFLNYYENGNSKMGWHGDSTHFLEEDTGIGILSVGDARIFQLRRKAAPTELFNYVLTPGSLIFMPASIQDEWQHAIPKVVSDQGRISLTFRKMKLN